MKTLKIPDPPSGMIYNSDKRKIDIVADGLQNTGGYCPCVPKHLHNISTKCPCVDAKIENNCRCGIFIKA